MGKSPKYQANPISKIFLKFQNCSGIWVECSSENFIRKGGAGGGTSGVLYQMLRESLGGESHAIDPFTLSGSVD